MKTIIKTVLALMLSLVFMLPTPVAARAVTVTVNGQVVDFSGDQPPVIVNGRTLVPIRKVVEKFGSDVVIDYDATQRLVTINKGISVLTLQIDNPYITVAESGKSWSDLMDTTPIIMNGRTLLPARYVAEELGGSVWWDPDTYTVSIYLDYEVSQNKVGNADLSLIRRNGKYGCVDRERNIVIPIEYDSIDFNEFGSSNVASNSGSFNNLSYAMAKVVQNGQTFYLGFCKAHSDANGYHPARLDRFDQVEMITVMIKNYLYVQKNGRWGIIDANGNIAVDINCEEKPIYIEDVYPPVAVVKRNGRYGISTLTNTLLAQPIYSKIGYRDYRTGNAVFYQDGYICAMRDGVAGYLDQTGSEVYPFRFQSVEPVQNGQATVLDNGETRKIKINGRQITFLNDSYY